MTNGSAFYMTGKAEDFFGRLVAAHETDTSDETFIAVNEAVEKLFVQGFANIFPQMRAMASYAPVRAVGEVHREGNLVGDLLEDDIVVVIL